MFIDTEIYFFKQKKRLIDLIIKKKIYLIYFVTPKNSLLIWNFFLFKFDKKKEDFAWRNKYCKISWIK